MDNKWQELKEFIKYLNDNSYEESVWITCGKILEKIKEME